jgi:hypothetical protein
MGFGSGIRDLEKTYFGSWIQGSKRHRIPDLVPQHCSDHYSWGETIEQEQEYVSPAGGLGTG